MKVSVFLSPAEIESTDLPGSWVVVVDVLRATSTLVTAFHNGVRSVRPVANAHDAQELATMMVPPPLLGGEIGGFRVEGFDLGNSPLDYQSEVVANRDIIFSTTNGTRTLLKVRAAERVFMGAFLNAGALAGFLAEQNPERLIFACAGLHGHFSLEDAVCSGYIISQISGVELAGDAAVAAVELSQALGREGEALFRRAFHGRYLQDKGFEKDLVFCAQKSVFEEIPEFVVETGEIVLARM